MLACLRAIAPRVSVPPGVQVFGLQWRAHGPPVDFVALLLASPATAGRIVHSHGIQVLHFRPQKKKTQKAGQQGIPHLLLSSSALKLSCLTLVCICADNNCGQALSTTPTPLPLAGPPDLFFLSTNVDWEHAGFGYCTWFAEHEPAKVGPLLRVCSVCRFGHVHVELAQRLPSKEGANRSLTHGLRVSGAGFGCWAPGWPYPSLTS